MSRTAEDMQSKYGRSLISIYTKCLSQRTAHVSPNMSAI